MATLKSVVNKWNLLPSKKRNGRLARAMAKTIILKAANVSGKRYLKSMGEAKFLNTMWNKKKQNFNGIKYEDEVWEYQPKVKHYHVDFKFIVGNSVHYIEYKGKLNGAGRTKLRDIKRCNPEKSLILVFERGGNKLSSKPGSLTYMKWAEQQGFPAFDTQQSGWEKELIKYLKENSDLIKRG